MLGQFTLIYVNLDFSLAETFALKLDKSLCPVINLCTGANPYILSKGKIRILT